MGMTVPEMREWVQDFSPGLIDTPEGDRLPLGAFPAALNVDFDKVDMRNHTATVKKRAGSQLITPASVSSGQKWDGLFEFRRAGTAPVLLGVCQTRLYQFDGVDTMTFVSTNFTTGQPARACFFKNNAIIFDGTANIRYDGSAVYALGFVKPGTPATSITAVAPVGAGISGTFEAYYVYYDAVMDHESSPSPTTTSTTVLAAQARRHTRPPGTPATNVSHWRAYVRRTDTAEFNFFRTATIPIATLTFDEELSDAARRDGGAGPFALDNEPPPGAFAILQVWKGYGIGVLPNDDSFYVSKLGDLEGWHPKNRFYVNRGDGEPITSVLPYGTNILVQKGHSSFWLLNDQVPFKIDPLNSKWGNVSQEAGLEVDGKFYAWDRERGPYWTDTVNWTSLVDGRIKNAIKSVNRNYLGDIRAVFDEAEQVIKWAVPTSASSRKRMLLKYHVGLETWLPPDTGLEYGSLCSFTGSDGTVGVYMGDYWGRIFRLGSGEREGVHSSVSGTTKLGPIPVTAATSSTVTCGGAAFYTTGAGLAGLPVAVKSSTGVWQWRRIESNTATVITLDTTNDAPWATVPTSSYTLIVGGIQWYQMTPRIDFGLPDIEKQLRLFLLQGRANAAGSVISVNVRYNVDGAEEAHADFALTGSGTAGVWGVMLWGTGVWGNISTRVRKSSCEREAFSVQFVLFNFNPDQPCAVSAYGVTADPIPGRKAQGYAEV